MKKLVLVAGTMGVGKSSVCRELLSRLTPGAYLDGDWCWNINPFSVTEENKRMVQDNIRHVLREYLTNSGLEYVIFCWVMHEQQIIDDVLEGLSGLEYEAHVFALTASEAVLKARLGADVAAGMRQADVIERSISRLPLYEKLNACLIDTGTLSPGEVAEFIAMKVRGGGI